MGCQGENGQIKSRVWRTSWLDLYTIWEQAYWFLLFSIDEFSCQWRKPINSDNVAGSRKHNLKFWTYYFYSLCQDTISLPFVCLQRDTHAGPPTEAAVCTCNFPICSSLLIQVVDEGKAWKKNNFFLLPFCLYWDGNRSSFNSHSLFIILCCLCNQPTQLLVEQTSAKENFLLVCLFILLIMDTGLRDILSCFIFRTLGGIITWLLVTLVFREKEVSSISQYHGYSSILLSPQKY